MFYSKPGANSEAIEAENRNQKKLEYLYKKPKSITLKELGKFSAFKEIFEEIPLEEQDFSYIFPNEDITINQDFIDGRKFGFILIKNGFSEEKYHEYVKATESIKHR